MASKTLHENGTITDDRTGNVLVEYPSNSNKGKINETGIEKDKSKKIITGEVITKKSITKEVRNSFIDAAGYVFTEVLVPALKNMLSDMIQNGTDIILFGESRGGSRRSRRIDGSNYVSYSSYADDNRRPVYSYGGRYRVDDIILESKADAEDVMDNLIETIDKYGVATVADLYDLIGKSSQYTDNDYGWTDLSLSKTRPVREGWLLDLPKPKSVK